jgi:hypothetical protein
MGISPVFLVDVLQHNLYTGGAHFANSIYDDSDTTSTTHTAIAVSSLGRSRSLAVQEATDR